MGIDSLTFVYIQIPLPTVLAMQELYGMFEYRVLVMLDLKHKICLFLRTDLFKDDRSSLWLLGGRLHKIICLHLNNISHSNIGHDK